LHSYPLPDNEDVVYLTGKARAISDAGVRAVAEGKSLEERDSLALDLSAQTLVEFTIETCLLTRTTGHGDENPQHTVWHAMDR
jgi:hypothetical protein